MVGGHASQKDFAHSRRVLWCQAKVVRQMIVDLGKVETLQMAISGSAAAGATRND
ncbi:hypothetical protein X743_29695 [Mesorhizobium sp. LNHC252B00]|nr:hypothetical protein X743_29695 [Mesorhizobium sp. LNHC252B00]